MAWLMTAAIAAAVGAASASGGTVYFPKGTYRVTSTVSINANNIDFLGEGEFVSTIDVNFATGDGLLFGPSSGTTSRNSINKLAVTSVSTIRVSGALIHLQNVNTMNISEIFVGVNADDGIFIDGSTSFDVFMDRITVLRCSNAGLRLGSSTSPANIFVSNAEFGSNGRGVLLTNVSGLYMQNTSILQNSAANLVTYPGVGQSVQYLFLQSVISDTVSAAAAFALIDNGGTLFDINLVNCWGSNSLYGIQTGHVDGPNISSCRFIGNQQTGILISYGKNVDVTACQVFGNSQQGDNSFPGVSIAANLSNFKVTGNTIGVGGATRSLPDQQNYGLIIGSGSGNNFVVANNAFVANRTGGFANGAAGTNVVIANNLTA